MDLRDQKKVGEDYGWVVNKVQWVQVGMRHYHKTTNKYHCPIINLDKIWSLVGEEVRLMPPLLESSSLQGSIHLALISWLP